EYAISAFETLNDPDFNPNLNRRKKNVSKILPQELIPQDVKDFCPPGYGDEYKIIVDMKTMKASKTANESIDAVPNNQVILLQYYYYLRECLEEMTWGDLVESYRKNLRRIKKRRMMENDFVTLMEEAER
ncbi:1503_t:CDS:2, partial [Scutellospora calospora]